MENKPNNLIALIIVAIITTCLGYAIALFLVSLVTKTEFVRLLTSPYTLCTFIALMGFEIYGVIKKNKQSEDK